MLLLVVTEVKSFDNIYNKWTKRVVLKSLKTGENFSFDYDYFLLNFEKILNR